MRSDALRSVKGILGDHYLPDRILTRRWFTAIIILTLLVVYVVYATAQLAQAAATRANVWDIEVGVLNNRLLMHHGVTNVFVFLLSDLALLREIGPYLILRVGSRRAWFHLQALSTALATVIYVVLLALLLSSVAVLVYPWSLDWSAAAAPLLHQQGLPAESSLRWSPLATVVSMFILLALTWLGIGIVVVTCTLATQNALIGLLAGLVLNYSALIIYLTDWRSPLLDVLWIHQRIYLWPGIATERPQIVTFAGSVFYWCVWIVMGLSALRRVCRNLDIVARASS